MGDLTEWHAPMRAALEEAQSAVAAKNHPFGAVLVIDSAIVMRAQNSVVTDGDPTCHAELNLVRQASKTLDRATMARATLVTSTEPCPMCAGAIYWAGLPRVVYGCTGKALGDISGEELDIPCAQVLGAGKLHKVETLGPVLEKEAETMHRAFWPTWSGEHFGGPPDKTRRVEDCSDAVQPTHDAESVSIESSLPSVTFGYTIVYVSDPASSLEFYEKAFGFKRQFLTPEKDYGQLDTGMTKLSFAAKPLAQSNLNNVSVVEVDGERPLGIEVALVMDDVPKGVENAIAGGATVIKSATLKPWGQTVAYVRAPDGTLVELCTPIKGV